METPFNIIIEPKKVTTKNKDFYQLPVYKAGIDLIKQLWNSTQKAPAIARTGLLKDTEEDIIQIIYNIKEAASCADKKEILGQTLKIAKQVQVAIRIYFDLGFITKKGFAVVSSKSEDVVRQLNGWFNKYNN